MKHTYELEECTCTNTDYCGDCEACGEHKEGTFQMSFMDYEDGEDLAEEYFERGEGCNMETVCYNCFYKAVKGELK